MVSTSLTSRLSSGGLQQHMFAEPSNVAERCRPEGWNCVSSSQCCSGLWCDWLFNCVKV